MRYLVFVSLLLTGCKAADFPVPDHPTEAQCDKFYEYATRALEQERFRGEYEHAHEAFLYFSEKYTQCEVNLNEVR